MSDVGIAPAPAPAPAASEVPINPNPVNAPQPVGPQAPQKPVGDVKGSEHRPETRRETIAKAFERARDPDRAKPEPAKARMGHNQPPEPMEKERPKKAERPEPVDLKKRPADQTRERGDHGHFAARDATPASGTKPDATQPARPGPQLPETAPYREAPQRMTAQAKAEWSKTPESVRGDVHRMHHEFARAYQQYRGDHEAMNTIRPYHRMAQQQGTSLDRALGNYVQMEQKLRQDPIAGLDVIVHNLNLRSPDGQKLGLRDIAWHILNQSPEQHKLLQNQNAQSAQSQQIGQLHQMVNTLASGIQRMQYDRQFTHTRSALDRYADAHPRFDELGPLIEREIKLGFDLDTAYRRAELLKPATHAAQTRNSTSAQTRPSDRSIRGAPDAGPSNGTSRRQDKPVSRRDAIANAIKRVNGSL